MYNNKSKEFYKIFWDNLEEPLLNSVRTSFLKQEVSSSKKHAEIKVIEKRVKIKDL